MTKNTLSASLIFTILLFSLRAQESSQWDFFHPGIDTSVEYDSNLFSNNNESSSLVGKTKPYIEYSREVGSVNANASLGVEFAEFENFHEENYEDVKSDFSITFPNRDDNNYNIKLGGEFKEVSAANEAVGTRTRSDDYKIYLNTEYYFDKKFGIGFDPEYKTSQTKTDGQRSRERSSFKLSGLYKYSEKVRASLSYRHRQTEVASPKGGGTVGNDVKQNAVYFGVDGDLLPKLSGSFDLGVQKAESERSGDIKDNNSWFSSVDLTWDTTDKWKTILAVSRDNSVTSGGQLNQGTSTGLKYRYDYDDKISFDGGFTWRHTNYTGGTAREDDAYDYASNMSYSLIEKQLSIDAKLKYTDQKSNGGVTFVYERLSFIISVPYRF